MFQVPKMPIKSARTIQVIIVEMTVGEGSKDDPHRVAQQLFTTEGTLICTIDPGPKKQEKPIKQSGAQ